MTPRRVLKRNSIELPAYGHFVLAPKEIPPSDCSWCSRTLVTNTGVGLVCPVCDVAPPVKGTRT